MPYISCLVRSWCIASATVRISSARARNSAALRILPTRGGSPARKDRLSFGEGWGRGILSWTAPRDETYIKLRRSFGRSQGGRYRSDSGELRLVAVFPYEMGEVLGVGTCSDAGTG